MSLANILWLWPLRFGATAYILRVTINGVTSNLNFPSSGSLSTTLDYFVSGDGQSGTESDATIGKADLVRMLQDTLRTHANGAAATVTLSNTTFKITIANATSVTVLWSHASTTLDPRIFGWKVGEDSSAGTSITAPNYPQGIYRPGRAIAEDSRDRQPTVAGITRSISGKRRVSRLALPVKERDFLLKYVLKEKVLTEYAASDNPFGAFEYAWLNAMSLGRVWRHYDNESHIYASNYKLYSARELADPLTRNAEFQVWWDISVKACLELDVAFTNEYSLRLETQNDYVTFGDPADMDGATRVVWSLWVKRDVLDGNGLLFYKNLCWLIQCFNSHVRVFIADASTGSWSQLSNTDNLLTAGDWNHIFVDYDGTLAAADRLKVYVDNVFANGAITGTISTSIRAGTTALVTLGGALGGFNDWRTGNIDEASVFIGAAAATASANRAGIYNNGVPQNVRTIAEPLYWLRQNNNHTDSMGRLTATPNGSPTFSTQVPR